jgi:hypothetical protein
MSEPVIDNAPGDQSVAIVVPSQGTDCYLRMGDAPDDEEAAHPRREIEQAVAMFESAPSVDNMAGGFIHGAQKGTGDLQAILSEGGWHDHTTGHRVTTTAKSKVEIVGGDYKLIACDGDAGIDFSGGHLRMWSKNTPGTLTKVFDSENKMALETINVDWRYSFRFHGGSYDEWWTGSSFSAHFGKGAPSGPDGEPGGEIGAVDAKPLKRYTEEISAEKIFEVFESTREHNETVRTGYYTEIRTVAHKLVAQQTATSIASTSTATLELRDSDTVGMANAEREMDPASVTESVWVGPSRCEVKASLAAISESYRGPLYEQSIATSRYVQSFFGGSFEDTCHAVHRAELYTCGILHRYVFAGLAIQTDVSAVRMDILGAGLWLESHGAVKVEERAGFVIERGKMETKNSLVDVKNALLEIHT